MGPIERLRLEHTAAITGLVVPALGPTWSEAAVREELSRSGAWALAIRDDARLLAVALGWLVAGELEISVVVVDPGHRRSGLGRTLVEAALADARTSGAVRAFLEVRSGNVAARALYAALGFEPTGLRRGYYRDGEDAVLMSRPL